MRTIKIFPNTNSLANAIAFRFCEESKQAAIQKRFYSVVLSGGNSAPIVYKLLCAPEFVDTIPWESVHLFWTDERCVSPDNIESNYGVIQRNILNSIPLPKGNIHPIRGENNPAIEAKRYSKEIENHKALRTNSKFIFDWALLGLGIDGHTASLFPGQAAFLKPKRFCEVAKHPETKQNRITLTAPAFKCAKNITYHVIGLEKAKVIAELFYELPQSNKYPSANIQGEWYLDKYAASFINNLRDNLF